MYTYFRRLGNQVLIYGLGDTINKIALVLTLPIFARYLSPADYGIAGILTVTNSLILGLIDLGLTNGIFRYYHEEENRLSLVSTAQIAATGLSLILALCAWPFADSISALLFKSSDYGYLVNLSLFTVPLTMVTVAPLSRLRLESKAHLYVLITVSRVVLQIAASVILIVWFSRGLKGMFEGPFLVALLYAIIVGVYSLKTSGIKFSRAIYRKMFAFGFPFILALLTFWVMDWADRFILVRMTNLSEVGLYNLGYNIGMAIMLPVGAFSTAWPAFYMTVAKEKNAKQIYSVIFTYYSLVIGFFVLLIAALAPDYFRIFTPGDYHAAYTIVPLITLSYALKGNFLIACVGTFIIKKTYWQFISEILAMVVNIAAMLILIPYLGRMGAAWATLAAYAVLLITIFLFTQKFYPIKYEYGRLARLLVIGGGLYALNKVIYQPTDLNMLLRLAIVLGYPLLIYLTNFFNIDETNRFKSIAKIIFRKKGPAQA